MLSDTLQLTDGTTPLDYELVSREGMNSVRVETTADSDVAAKLIIKNTIPSSLTSKRRHLFQLSQVEEDGTTGDIYEASCHVVISRDLKFSDAEILIMLKRLSDLISTDADMESALKGGN